MPWSKGLLVDYSKSLLSVVYNVNWIIKLTKRKQYWVTHSWCHNKRSVPQILSTELAMLLWEIFGTNAENKITFLLIHGYVSNKDKSCKIENLSVWTTVSCFFLVFFSWKRKKVLSNIFSFFLEKTGKNSFNIWLPMLKKCRFQAKCPFFISFRFRPKVQEDIIASLWWKYGATKVRNF